MATWAEFETAAPELAAIGTERIKRYKVVLLGTVRKDGSARVTPVEHAFRDGNLLLGFMPKSMKGRDLTRDPRVTVHNAVVGDDDGEFKLVGRAVAAGAKDKTRYRNLVFEETGWKPPADSYWFTVDIRRAWAIDYATGKQRVQSWTA